MQSLTKKDIRLIVDEGIDQNKTILTLKTDVAGLKTDVAGLKTDVAGLKTDVAGLKTDMSSVKGEQHRQGILMEEMRDNINLIVEAISPLLRKSEGMDELNENIAENQAQITIVKSTLRSHMENKNIHRKE